MCIHTGYSKSGFSLLEIIIAIAIIALFTILPILAYTSYQKKSRDEKRISDISRVAQALESYKAEKGTYPMNLEDLVKDGYLPDLPKDPFDGQQLSWSTDGETYKYLFESADGSDYTLTAPLEEGGFVGGVHSGSGGNTPGSGTYYQASAAHPGGIVIPATQLTQAAQVTPSQVPATSTPYLTQVPLVSITVTPSPSSTPSPSTTISNTPSPAISTAPSSYYIKNLSMYQYQNVNAVTKTSDSGLIIGGDVNNGVRLPYIAKFNATGSLQWSKVLNVGSIGFTVSSIVGIAQDLDGGYVTVASGTGTGGGLYGAIIVMKVDSTGNVLYARSFAAGYGSQPYAVISGSNGPIISGSSGIPRICGSNTCITNSAYLLQLDSNGDKIWDVIMADTSGNGASYLQSLVENTDHSITAAGSIQIGTNYNVLLIKVNSSGAPQWEKRTPPPGSFTTAQGTGVVQTNDGGFAVSGTTGYLGQNIFIQKYDSSGGEQWTRAVDGSASKGIALDIDGGLVSAGTRSDNTFIYKVSSSGTLTWAKEVGIKSTYDHEAAQAIAAMNGGGVAVVGSAYNDQNGSGTYTYFNTVIKVDTSGNVSSCSQVASLVPSFTSYTLLESAQLLTSLNTVTQTNIGSSSSNVTVYTGNTCN